MTRFVTALALLTVALCGASFAAEEDPIGAKLATAKAEYEKNTTKAREGLLANLKKKAEVEQKAGKLEALEKVQEQTTAFEDKGTLPKVVPTRDYTEAMRAARERLSKAYVTAKSEYTIAGKLDLAKGAQAALEELKKEANDTPDDGFAVGTKFAGPVRTVVGQPNGKPPVVTDGEWKTTITKRSGQEFTAESGEHQWEGTITNGLVKMMYAKAPKGAAIDLVGNVFFLGRFDKEKGTLVGDMHKKTDKDFGRSLKLKIDKD